MPTNESEGEGKCERTYKVVVWAKAGQEGRLLLFLRLDQPAYVLGWKKASEVERLKVLERWQKPEGWRPKRRKKWLNKSRCGNESFERVKFAGKFWNNKMK